MATNYSGDGVEITLSASGDADSWQYHFVKLAGDAKLFDLATGASGPQAIGVLQNDPNTGEAGNIRVAGTSLVRCDGSGTAIVYGDYIAPDSDGQGIVAAASAFAGISFGATSTASTLLEVLLLQGQTLLADNTP